MNTLILPKNVLLIVLIQSTRKLETAIVNVFLLIPPPGE